MRPLPGADFKGGEFTPFGCDYLLASTALAARAQDYRVIDSAEAGAASDDYPIACDFA